MLHDSTGSNIIIIHICFVDIYELSLEIKKKVDFRGTKIQLHVIKSRHSSEEIIVRSPELILNRIVPVLDPPPLSFG